uniref:Uncharacterized protein n=1 Tax=Solanum lycopersicum TaxID=4081 RepID=A0A3Q7G975_SOLLC
MRRTTLRFTIREFAIISDLNCSDNGADFCFDTDQPNRIIAEYFLVNSPITKARLAEAFKAKIKFRNIEPTAMEIKILQLPPPIDQSISQAPQIECLDHNKATEPDDFQKPPIITRRKGKEEVIECSSPIRKKKKQSVLVISLNKSSTKAIKIYTRRSMSRKAIRSQSININSVEKHSDVGTSHNYKRREQKGVQDIIQMGQSKESTCITILLNEFEAFKKSVKDDFAYLRKIIEDNFKTMLKAINSKESDVNVVDDHQESRIEDFHHQPTYSPYEPQSQSRKSKDQEFQAIVENLGDNLKDLNSNSALLDQVDLGDNLNDLSGTASPDQKLLDATVDA